MINEIKKFIIIDAYAVLYRAWFALPPLKDPKGKIVNAVYGFSNFLLKLLKEKNPDYIAVAYDTAAPRKKKKKFQEYKANRIPQPQEFYDQISISKDVLRAFSINFFAQEGFEADDIISSIKQKANDDLPALQISIFTGDQDLLQLVDDLTKICLLKQNVSQTKIYGVKEVEKGYGLLPSQLIELKALAGDPSDNIPGVPGIGSNIATNLLEKFGTLENIYQAIEKNEMKKEKVRERIINILSQSEKQVFLFKELVTLKNNVNLKNFKLKKCRLKKLNIKNIKELFNKFGFKSLAVRVEALNKQQKTLF